MPLLQGVWSHGLVTTHLDRALVTTHLDRALVTTHLDHAFVATHLDRALVTTHLDHALVATHLAGFMYGLKPIPFKTKPVCASRNRYARQNEAGMQSQNEVGMQVG